jgi:putative Mn2+ efflux pump MntP
VAIQTAELTSDGTGMASDLVNSIYGGDYCGDETLMYIGATMDAADIAFSAGYSVLDTEEADKTVMSIGASTTVSAYDVSIDYRQTTKDYERGNIEDTQSVVALGLGTSLGDGVDLGLSFSTSDVSEAAQAVVGDTNYYFAEASLTVGF